MAKDYEEKSSKIDDYPEIYGVHFNNKNQKVFDRRDFIKAATVVGASIALTGCNSKDEERIAKALEQTLQAREKEEGSEESGEEETSKSTVSQVDSSSTINITGKWIGEIGNDEWSSMIEINIDEICQVGTICGTYRLLDGNSRGELELLEISGSEYRFIEVPEIEENIPGPGYQTMSLIDEVTLQWSFEQELSSGEVFMSEGVLQNAAYLPTETPTNTPTNTPTEVPTNTEIPTPKGEVTTAHSMFKGPQTNHPFIKKTTLGEEVWILGKTDDGVWYKIMDADGAVGWCYSEFIKLISNVSIPTIYDIPTPVPAPCTCDVYTPCDCDSYSAPCSCDTHSTNVCTCDQVCTCDTVHYWYPD